MKALRCVKEVYPIHRGRLVSFLSVAGQTGRLPLHQHLCLEL